MPPRALACPECGADHRSGWKEDALLEDDLPSDDFDYDDFVAREFGNGAGKTSRVHPVWIVVTVALLIALILGGWLAGF